MKKNHEIAGITNCEITKCGDPLYKRKFRHTYVSIEYEFSIESNLSGYTFVNLSCLYYWLVKECGYLYTKKIGNNYPHDI